MTSLTKGIIRVGTLGVVIGLILAFGDLDSIWQGARRAGIEAILAALTLSVLIVAISAWKWHLVVPEVQISTLCKIVLIGQFYSFSLFGQASGEAAKIYVLGRTLGKLRGSMVSVLADRLTSIIGLLVVSIIGFSLSPTDDPYNFKEISVIVLVAFVVLLFALRYELVLLLATRLESRIEHSAPRLGKITRYFRQAVEQWHVSMRNMRRVLAAVLFGALIHVCNAALVMILAQGVGIGVSFFDWCWIVGIMGIAGLVPITMGQLTSYATMVALLQLFNVSVADALAVSMMILAVHFFSAATGALLEWIRWQKVLVPRPPDDVND